MVACNSQADCNAGPCICDTPTPTPSQVPTTIASPTPLPTPTPTCGNVCDLTSFLPISPNNTCTNDNDCQFICAFSGLGQSTFCTGSPLPLPCDSNLDCNYGSCIDTCDTPPSFGVCCSGSPTTCNDFLTTDKICSRVGGVYQGDNSTCETVGECPITSPTPSQVPTPSCPIQSCPTPSCPSPTPIPTPTPTPSPTPCDGDDDDDDCEPDDDDDDDDAAGFLNKQGKEKTNNNNLKNNATNVLNFLTYLLYYLL